jgi:hypothetical protein
MKLITKLSDKYYSLRYRELSDPAWLQQKFVNEKRSPDDIAGIIGCDVSVVNKKLVIFGLMATDTVFGVYTGRFHTLAKHKGIIKLMKPFIRNIETTTDEIYTRTASINSRIFKEILDDVEKVDRDVQDSSAKVLGFTRKYFYLLMAKFIICLYEFDTYYAERMDYILLRVLERKEEFYLSAITTNPGHWYPTRSQEALQQYFIGRVFGKDSNAMIFRVNKKEELTAATVSVSNEI